MKKNAPIRWVFKRIRRRIPALAGLTVCNILNSLLSVLFALSSANLIDSATSGNREDFWLACILQAAIILGLLLTLYLCRHLKERTVADMNRDWKQTLLHQLLYSDYTGVKEYHSGELLNRINNDVQALDNGVLTLLPSLAFMVTRLISVVGVLAAMEPIFTVAALAAGILVAVITGLVRKRLKNLNKQVSAANGKVSGFIQETLEKLLMVQAMDVSAEMERRSDLLTWEHYELQRKRRNISLFSSSCMDILAYGAYFAAMLYCGHGLLLGSMSFGTLTAVTSLVSQLQGPMVNLSSIFPQYISICAAAERLMELDSLFLGDDLPQQDGHALYEKMESIEAQALCFSYDRDQVFENAGFTLPKGEFGVILGHSGIGKSTLLKLMLGMFPPHSGQLYAATSQGPIPLNRETRKLFAYVPQGNLLLSGTLRDNLLLTRPNASQEEIDRAVYISCMDEFLSAMPQGLETVIGESAMGLSEGQAQRLSIARAILSDAPVLLLDEATSALDAQTEQTVLERLRQLPDKTCIAVTHRPAAIALSDWTMEMRDGKCIVVRQK